ncbi:MAG: hypothetical protein ACFFER_06830, partial [Candidatus Thorarchaeota archaeon]
NALGPPDGEFAQIYSDYGNGYITLDMGDDEEIIDDVWDDFVVIAEGSYSVYGGSSLDEIFTLIGRGEGTSGFDLSSVSLNTAKYLKIEIYAGGLVEIDAVQALHFNSPASDTSSPLILGPADIWIWENQTTVSLEWSASDATPWDYEIIVNGNSTFHGGWNGSDISFVLTPIATGDWYITLILRDVFGNTAIDSVIIHVMAIDNVIDTLVWEPIFWTEILLLIGVIALWGGWIIFSEWTADKIDSASMVAPYLY